MVKIVTVPNDVLSKKAKKIDKIDKDIIKILSGMKIALLSAKDPEGVGLAAPQIGKSLSMFLMKPTHKSAIKVFINPEIVSTKDDQEVKTGKAHTKLEGCLSLPTIWGEVKRNSAIAISYQIENGKTFTSKYKGFIATIIQHEIDHLDGILFTKRVLEQNGILYKSRKDKDGKDIFEEIEV